MNGFKTFINRHFDSKVVNESIAILSQYRVSRLTGLGFISIGSDYITGLLEKAPFIAAGVLIFTSISTCGSLALCLGALFYFLKLSHMSQDYVEKIVWFFIKQLAEKFKINIRRKTLKPTKKQDDISEGAKNLNSVTDKDDSTEQCTEEITNLGNDDECILEKKHIETSQIVDSTEEEISSEKKETLYEDRQNTQKEEKNIELNENQLNNQEHESKVRKRDVPRKEEVAEAKTSELEKPTTVEGGLEEKGGNELAIANNSLFFHSTIFFIWCIITLINIPAVLTWAHNFKFSKTLAPDSSFIPGFVLSLCAFPLWQFDLPKTNRKWSTLLEIFTIVISVVSLTFATISIYRLNYLLTLFIVVLISHQLFAPQNTTDLEASSAVDDNDKAENKPNYDNVKLKLN